MNKFLVLVLLAVSMNCYSQKDDLQYYKIVDSSLNISISYSEKWRELKTESSISSSDTRNKYIPVIHIESNPNYISDINFSPSVVSALLVTKDLEYDTTTLHNEDEYLNQIKSEMSQFYGHLQFEDETQSTAINSRVLRSLKGFVNTMGYQFYQEYITYFFDKKYITIVLIYSNEETRSELTSLISFINEK